MSVYKKLQEARCEMQRLPLTKSGKNAFAKYNYFELGDFMPAINDLFNEKGLCGCVSFTAELATLRIVDVDDGSFIEFTSPMGRADLKGCHEVQNIGAVETYQRRYLYVTALEIVEHDALDAVTGSGKPTQNAEVTVLTTTPTLIGHNELTQLRMAIKEAGITEDQLCAISNPKLDSLQCMELSRFAKAMRYLKKLSQGDAA